MLKGVDADSTNRTRIYPNAAATLGKQTACATYSGRNQVNGPAATAAAISNLTEVRSATAIAAVCQDSSVNSDRHGADNTERATATTTSSSKPSKSTSASRTAAQWYKNYVSKSDAGGPPRASGCVASA
jgi:hypothetical protein